MFLLDAVMVTGSASNGGRLSGGLDLALNIYQKSAKKLPLLVMCPGLLSFNCYDHETHSLQ